MSAFFSDPLHTGALVITAAIFVVLGIQYFTRDPNYNPKNLPLPPGPKPLPFIGNVLDMPQDKPWLKFKEMSQKYGEYEQLQSSKEKSVANAATGDIVNLRLFNQPMLVMNSAEVVMDLLEKRSTIYSDKLNQVMLTQL